MDRYSQISHKCYLIQNRITQIYTWKNRLLNLLKLYVVNKIYKNNFNYGNLKIFFVFYTCNQYFYRNLFKFKNFN